MAVTTSHIESISSNGQCVYALEWDTGAPSGSGCERVYGHDGVYLVMTDDGDEVETYSSLLDAIAQTEQLHSVGPATLSISSTLLAAEDIIPLLRPFPGVDTTALSIRINGRIHEISLA